MVSHSILCSTQCGRYGDLSQVSTPRLLLEEVEDSFRRIDGRASTDRDDNVGASFFERLDTIFDASDRCMLADVREGCAVSIVLLQNVLYFPDNVSLLTKPPT
jgi:hypothetical protein